MGTSNGQAIVGKKIYSIGTSTRSLDEFVSLLRQYGIETAVDVRSFPTSRFEHFKRDAFERGLRELGFRYVYLGAELGGYRRGGYEHYMATPGFRAGLSKLVGIGNSSMTAFVCAERLPWRCHRRWIGARLMREEWEVIHIVDERRTWIPGASSREGTGQGRPLKRDRRTVSSGN